MMITAEWWAHVFGSGLLALAISGAVLIAVEFAAPYAFLNDYPADIRRAAAAPTARQRRAGVIGGIVFIVVLVLSIAGVVFAWAWRHPNAGFIELALMALMVSTMFVVFDIVIVDWLLLCTIRPARLVYAGTEDCAGWRDYSFHVTDQLRPRAVAVLFGMSAVVGVLAWWLA